MPERNEDNTMQAQARRVADAIDALKSAIWLEVTKARCAWRALRGWSYYRLTRQAPRGMSLGFCYRMQLDLELRCQRWVKIKRGGAE